METASNTSESGNPVEKEAKAAEEQIETEAPPTKEENTEIESKKDVKEEKETKTEETASKKKKSRKKKNKKKIIITEEDFGPEVDFTKKEGFVYDPQIAEFGIDEVQLKKRPWLIQDVRSVLYLRRLGIDSIQLWFLERRHNKLVHGLASVRKLTPKQILKEESLIWRNDFIFSQRNNQV